MIVELSYKTLRSSVKYVELITVITGTVYLYKYKHTVLKYFLMYLWYSVLTDFLGKWYITHTEHTHNHIIYNFYYLITFCFLLLLYRKLVAYKNHKKWILYFTVLYFFSFFLNLFYQDYYTQIQAIPFIIGAISLVISIVFYFQEVLNSNEVLNIFKNLIFWISVGLLIYYIGKIPARIVTNHWSEFKHYKIIYALTHILNIIMNLFFIIGFICSKEEKEKL